MNKNYSIPKISFIIPSRNNLKYLKYAYKALRSYNMRNDHEICVASDYSTDDTESWCKEIATTDNDFKYIVNDGTWFGKNTKKKSRMGHTLLYDKLVDEVSTSNIIMIYHADMICISQNFDYHILKYLTDTKKMVCATRIEPPLHPPEPTIKIIHDFGLEPEHFNEEQFLSFTSKEMQQNENKITHGMFAPWAMYKEEFQSINGHEPIFSPQSREDSSLFQRLLLHNVQLIQSWSAMVYHLTCRGSRFAQGIGKDSDEWQKTNYKGERNFLRKWGNMVDTDKYLHPIIHPKYQIQLVLDCVDGINNENFYEILRIAEPHVSQIIIHDTKRLYSEDVEKYIETEQMITSYDMKERVVYNPRKKQEEMDIVIYSTPRLLSNDSLIFIQMINTIIEQSIDEPGVYEYEKNRIKVNKLKSDYYLENIIA